MVGVLLKVRIACVTSQVTRWVSYQRSELLVFHPLNTHHVTGDETQSVLTFYETLTMLLGMKRQAVLTFNTTPTKLLGMRHNQFLLFIRHPPCYLG
jgi:hypothetical protein